jgi:hypothetical protein
MYQKSIHHIEVWLWNMITQRTQKLLLSTYNPAGISLLPKRNAFSFIDNDHVRIKYFHKRSTKSLDFEQPLYDITMLHWIDDESFYFSACEHRRYRLYHAMIDGGSVCIHGSDHYDCLYPQKVDNALFFIQREPKVISSQGGNIKQCFNLMKIDYPAQAQEKVCSIEIPGQLETESEIICSFSKPVAFLFMINEHEGYVLEHPDEIHPKDDLIPFSLLYLNDRGEGWHSETILEFSIPSSLLILGSDQRLFESMLPILPKYHNDDLYYMDAIQHIDGLSLGIYQYNVKSKERMLISDQTTINCSPLVLSSNDILYGGQLGNSLFPNIQLDKEGIVVNLPRFEAIRHNSF